MESVLVQSSGDAPADKVIISAQFHFKTADLPVCLIFILAYELYSPVNNAL